MAQQAQFLIETQNDALAKRIENARRTRLMREVVAASALAVVLALAFGIWLARPFKRLERAIVGLGENRLDEPIDIRGPADVRRVSQQLEWLRLRLTELDADKARFLRHVSHELKTPLAALREGVSLLEDGVTGALNPAQREVAQILQQNTVSLQSQIEALLRFNAAAFEARELRRERTALLPLIEEQVEAQRLQWQAHGLRVRAEGEPIAITVDPAKLGTALANLLSNAIRFSSAAGTITLEVSGTPDIGASTSPTPAPASPRATATASSSRSTAANASRSTRSKAPASACRSCRSTLQPMVGRITLLPGGPGARFRIELPRSA
jgi:two-component system sensor histidine kinase GlrK